MGQGQKSLSIVDMLCPYKVLTLNRHISVTQNSYARNSVIKKLEDKSMSFERLLASNDGEQLKNIEQSKNEALEGASCKDK